MKLHRLFLYFLALAGSAFLSSCVGPMAVSYNDGQNRVNIRKDEVGGIAIDLESAK